MILKIKEKQAEKVHEFVQRLCCNCVDGNCLLLDDGEEHACVQQNSFSRIYCNYFKRAVLPAEKELYREITSQNKSKN